MLLSVIHAKTALSQTISLPSFATAAQKFLSTTKNLWQGEDFIGRLGKEIEGREYFILIISPRSIASKWVKAEVSWALHNNKTIIPVLLEPASMTEFFLFGKS